MAGFWHAGNRIANEQSGMLYLQIEARAIAPFSLQGLRHGQF